MKKRIQSSQISQAVVTLSGGKVYSMEYQTLPGLSETIWKLLFESNSQFECIVTLPSGAEYSWDPVYAHSCFAKGRITLDQFVKHQFSKETEL